MVDYRRMGNMKEQNLGNATSPITLLHQLRDLWKSPRGTVLRIESLALVAIALSFLVAAFGSCRRWSNRWIVQKGFLAANVLSVSLGTYSIGLMQSSSVKSEMYPIWALSLFTLLPCIDLITSYVGLDYKSPLSKMVFQICLYFGYVLLISISTTPTDIGNKAIGILCAITFIKGIHRSLALVLPGRLRDRIESLSDGSEKLYFLPKWFKGWGKMMVDISPDLDASHREVSMDDICSWCQGGNDDDDCLKEDKKENGELPIQDVSMAFSLSHLLQRHFIGLSRTGESHTIFGRADTTTIDYKWALKLVEVELAFLYDTFFTSNAFLHYYQAKAASLWTLASLLGICFVGVTVAIPGTMTRRSATPGPGAGTSIVVDTTTADLIITLIIFVSLALHQLMLLVRCWTSKWARVAIACQYVRNQGKGDNGPIWWMWRPIWWMKLKEFIVTMNINWYDKYLWQEKVGQYSIVEGSINGEWKLFSIKLPFWVARVSRICAYFIRIFGFQYIWQVLLELWGSKTKGGASVRLHADVKASIAEFLGQINSDRTDKDWISFFIASGIQGRDILYQPIYSPRSQDATNCLLSWHIATCYCELAERKQEDSTGCKGNAVATAWFKKAGGCFLTQNADVAAGGGEAEKYRRVAIALSKYYGYLVKSAPELLPGSSEDTKHLYGQIVSHAKLIDWRARATPREVLKSVRIDRQLGYLLPGFDLGAYLLGEIHCEDGRMCRDHWKLLARFWVQALVYVAPYGNLESHLQHLSQGGEFITHLWALLFHLGTYQWKMTSDEEFSKICEEIERESFPSEEETPSSSSSSTEYFDC